MNTVLYNLYPRFKKNFKFFLTFKHSKHMKSIKRVRGFVFQHSPKTESPTSQKEGFSFTPPKNREKARNIDRVSRFLFPIVFILFNVGYWLVYLVLWEPVVDKHSGSEGVTIAVNLKDD